MRWKAFFKAMFDWRPFSILEYPLENLIFVMGAAVVMILIEQC